MTHVTDLILKNNNGRKKLVFCHFNEEIRVMNDILSNDYTVGIINGSVSAVERNRLMTSCDIDVLLLQIQSCCEGLNLQQYSEIYFISPSWNPCVEDQAIARAHRVGQTQAIDVFRFTMEDFGDVENIETYSQCVQDSKREIANDMYNNM
jgi:SNF2 family DNA or RNA helicase